MLHHLGDQMQAVSADSGVPEPSLEDLGIPAGLRRSPQNIGAVRKFAQNMADNIIQSFIRQMEMVEPEVPSSNQDPDALAEELASAVIEIALREACGGCNVEGFQSSRSTGVKVDEEQAENLAFLDESGRERDFPSMDAEMDPVKELHTSKDIQSYHPPLSQSGLPLVGSLDYPDAPPTTPLLPELERSRHSFARKLKGGLAKVFLPSPPPPTPKDNEDDTDSANLRVDLMERLMHSLSTDDSTRNYFEVGPHGAANMEAFAEALSCNIIDWVLSAKSREQLADDSNLHLLAHQLAETIITSSLDEAKMTV
ncbi:uncharacterized protein si:dkey-171c9.3 [Lates calcarifer]|uniref:Uncharacterized protein si:dkey-171c9.3 n=1 Tax=Lates calcarifer TaxID=8187 RepID=A0AAJ7QM03_LATCA|nr:uncharacterized protein si:dkey-171c9.3 [Lates calcarifer]